MKHKIIRRFFLTLTLGLTLAIATPAPVHAQTPIPNPGPQQDTTGMQGTIPSPPPRTPATISTPVNGRTFTEMPIDVSGLCTTGLLVKIFSNNIFIGSTECQGGSYRLQVDLFSGQNALVAKVYDSLDQEGPESNTVNVNFQGAEFAPFGQRISLSSPIARNGALVGAAMNWPIILSGGAGPYAISIDWGDGTASELKSVAFAGEIMLSHVYKKAGVYRVIVKATDVNGTAAFLQLVGVGSGKVTQAGPKEGKDDGQTLVRTIYIWWPVLLLIPFAIMAFIIGRKYELVAIHRRLERQANLYKNEIQR